MKELPPSQAADRVEELLAEALDRLQAGGSQALAGFLGEHPLERAELEAELARLHELGLVSTRPAEPAIEQVGDFRLVRRIGSGGMGVVHEAVQVSLGRRVAVKLVRPELVFSEHSRRRFQREVEAASRLAHPGIAQVFAVGREDELPWYAMELVDGVGLDVLVRAFEGRDLQRLRAAEVAAEIERALGPRTGSSGMAGEAFAGSWVDLALRLARQVAEALEHAHGRGVVHRDVKPSNVLVTRAGRAILVDFGLALTEETPRMTISNTQPGSLPYMSPEQLAGERAGARSDVYSLGVTLYELLAGRPAFAGSAEKARASIAEGRHPPLAPWLPSDLRTVVATAMERDPERRYATAADFARDLRNLLGRRPIEARTPSLALRLMRWGQRHPRLAASAITALVVCFGALAVSLGRERQHSRAVRAERDRAELELARSQLERGALLAQSGVLTAAEALLWPQYFAAADREEALWALRNLYHRIPCRATGPMVPGSKTGVVCVNLIPHPDGRRLFSAGEDGVLRVHDLETLESRVLDLGEPAWVDLELAPRRGLLFRSGPRLDAFGVDTLERVRSFENAADAVALKLLPGEEVLLVGGADGVLRSLDLDSGEVRAETPLFEGAVLDLDLAPDGGLVAIEENGALELLDPPYETPRLTIETQAMVVRFSPDGQRVFSASRNTINAWDCGSGERLETLDATTNGTLRLLCFAPQSGDLLSGGWWALDRWNLGDGSWRRLVGLQTNALVPLPGLGLWAASHGADLRLWQDAAILGRPDLDVMKGPAVVRFGQDGERLYLSSGSGHVRTFETAGWTLLGEFRAHERRVILALGCESQDILWTSGTDKTARLWRGDRADPVCEIEAYNGPMDLSPDGGSIAIASSAFEVEIRDACDGALVRRFPAASDEILCLRFSPDGKRVVLTSRDRCVHALSIDGTPLAALEMEWTPLAVALHADGRRAAVSSWEGHVWIVDCESGERRSLVGHNGSIWDLCFRPGHPDQLAVASGDGIVRLWDVATGRSLLFLDEFDGYEISSVDFDPSGRWLAFGSLDGRVRVIDLWDSLRCVAGNLPHQARLMGVPEEVVQGLLHELDSSR